MKKTFIILPIMAGAIFLGGCGNGKPVTSPIGENQTETREATEVDKGSQSGSIVGSLKEMVGAGKQMECVMAQDGMETKTYIEGKKYKSVITSAQVTVTNLFDGETFYNWNTKTKTGTKMTMACIEEIGKNLPKTNGDSNSNFTSTDELINKEEKNNNCQEASGTVDFTVPTDIEFVDQCLMLQNIPKNLPNGELPVDFNMPTE